MQIYIFIALLPFGTRMNTRLQKRGRGKRTGAETLRKLPLGCVCFAHVHVSLHALVS